MQRKRPELGDGKDFNTTCMPKACDLQYYVFSSPPQPAWGRPKYRDNLCRQRGVHDYYNLMWDPHVRRGDPKKRVPTLADIKACLDRPKKLRTCIPPRRPNTPPPVDGRKHFDTQTDNLLELLDFDPTELSIQTQTEILYEMPLEPYRVKVKIGDDRGTQIWPGELFDFNRETRPIIESLIGRVVEQALLETMEEEELQALADQQCAFEEKRRQEMLRLRRLQEREKRVIAEKERLAKEQLELLKTQKELECRLGATVFTSAELRDLLCSAIQDLNLGGYLHDKTLRAIKQEFIPWLNEGIEKEVNMAYVSRNILDEIIREVGLKREAEYATRVSFYDEDEEFPISSAFQEMAGEGGEGCLQ